MKQTVITLWKNKNIKADLTICAFPEKDPLRSAVLVVPGGGYGCICRSTEGDPIAKRFAKLGFRTFILNYRVSPDRFPAPQQDLIRAIKLIRHNAKEWKLFPDKLAVCGFSAGGHLCACAGTIWQEINADDGDAADTENARPDAMLLAYPVITANKATGHLESFQNLLGDDCDKMKDSLSLEKRISDLTPPAFIWHTAEDQIVNAENSLCFAEALRKLKIPNELHIFPHGPHGMQLGYGRPDISQWPDQAAAFLKGTCGFPIPAKKTAPKKTVILTFDDACKSHIENAAPILKQYGFNATFFICRFDDNWRKDNEKYLMNAGEIRKLSDMGFDIGNHTWKHSNLQKCTQKQIEKEIDDLNDFLTSAGIPKPVSFAYPGGPYAENAVNVIKSRGLKAARIVGPGSWSYGKTDPMQIPSVSLKNGTMLEFYQSVSLADKTHCPVLLFHGVPEYVHPWVHTPVRMFQFCMKYLYDNGYRVISMRQYIEENEK